MTLTLEGARQHMINLDALITVAFEAVKKNYIDKNPGAIVPEFSSLPPDEQEEMKEAFGIIIRSTGLIEKVEALNAEVARLNAIIDKVMAHDSNLIDHLTDPNRN